MSKPWNYNTKKLVNDLNLSAQRSYEYDTLMRFIRNRYSYEFIDEAQKKKYRHTLPFQYLEKIVGEFGRAAVYNHPDYGLAVYKAVMSGSLDIYGRPNVYFLYTANGGGNIKVPADDPNLVLLQDVFNGRSFTYLAERYGLQLGKIRETIMTNTHGMRHPYIIQAPKDKVLEVQMVLESINEKSSVLVDPNLEFSETVKVVDLKTPDNLKSLEDEYNTTLAKFMKELGYSTNDIDKKERLVSAEAEDDDGILRTFDSEPYLNRLEFIELMEEKFKIKLKLVKNNNDLYTEDTDTTNETPKEDK